MSAVSSSSSASEKSPEAFRTISEVSAELDVPQHVLRFWESRFSQIRPIKRGGNRRYYRPEDVDLLRGIRALLYCDGFTIKGVQKLLREQGGRYVTGLGRADCSLIGRLSEIHSDVLAARPPRDARAAIAAVKAAHPDAIVADAIAADTITAEADKNTPPRVLLDEARRVKLELLLAELLRLKAHLRSAATLKLAAE